MSRDCSRTYIHLHSPRHADLFEEFNSDPSPQSQGVPPSINQLSSLSQPSHALHNSLVTGLPNEDIDIPPHLQPPNPEDEDDIVPDQHAAFGITQAMAKREQADRSWRDFETLSGLVRGANLDHKKALNASANNGYAGVGVVSGVAKRPIRK